MNKRWYSVELQKSSAPAFRRALNALNIVYEVSECYSLIHFDVYIDRQSIEYHALSEFLERL